MYLCSNCVFTVYTNSLPHQKSSTGSRYTCYWTCVVDMCGSSTPPPVTSTSNTVTLVHER